MSLFKKIGETLSNLLGSADTKTSTTPNAQQNNKYGPNKPYNPFVDKNGNLINPYINYQKVLDDDNVTKRAKQYIQEATGIQPTKPFDDVATSAGQRIKNANSYNEKVASVSKGLSISDAAQKYIGTPYVWGGSSKAHGGMDCSGFVYNALKDAGYDVGRTNAQGYRSRGTVVSKSDMQPGDLIFFGKNNNDASHIGIYLGNGKMIHSAGGQRNTKSNPGKGVSIVNVDHRSDFLEARRY